MGAKNNILTQYRGRFGVVRSFPPTTAMTTHPGSRHNHHSFILAFWQDGIYRPAWRVSLENVRTNERIGFNSLEALMRYLEQQLIAVSRGGELTSPAEQPGSREPPLEQ